MKLSQTQKSFSQVFAQLLKYKSNLEHFDKKDAPHTLYISKIADF